MTSGKVPLYGTTPALDLLHNTSFDSSNILLIGSTDARHIIKTSSLNSSSTPINYYLIEPQAPLICRHLLLLHILLDTTLSPAESVSLFLQLYQNTRISQRAHDYMVATSTSLIQLVTGTSDNNPLSPHTNFTKLRFRERDDLEFTLQFYRGKGMFKLIDMWDARLRSHYDTRYDSRENVVDWDYHFRVREVASIVHPKEFLGWRMNGDAFRMSEVGTLDNRTFATVDGISVDGQTVAKWGFFSDITSGPFYAYGIDTPNTSLLEKANEAHRHSSQEVSEYNLESYVTALRAPITHPWSITFLPCDVELTVVKYAHRYVDKFECIYLANHVAHHVAKCRGMLKSGGVVVVEGARFVVDLKSELVAEYTKKVCEMAKDAGLLHQDREDVNNLYFIKE